MGRIDTTSNAELLLHGIGQGAGIYDQGQRLALAQQAEQWQQQFQAQQLELARRRVAEEATRRVRQREATARVLAAMQGPQAGMTPQQQGYGPPAPQVPSQGYGPPDPAQQQAAMPQATAIDPQDLADAESWAASAYGKGVEWQRERERARQNLELARESGVIKMSPKVREEAMKYGIPPSPEDFPLTERQAKTQQDEAQRADLIAYLRMDPAGMQAVGLRPDANIEQLGTHQLDALVAALHKRNAAMAMGTDPATQQAMAELAPDAQARLQAAITIGGGRPTPNEVLGVISGKSDPLADDRARLAVSEATHKAKTALDLYKSIAGTTAPPTEDEIKTASGPKPRFFTGGWSSATRKVQAWNDYVAAESGVDQAYQTARASLGGPSSRPLGGQAVSTVSPIGTAPSQADDARITAMVREMKAKGMTRDQIKEALAQQGIQ